MVSMEPGEINCMQIIVHNEVQTRTEAHLSGVWASKYYVQGNAHIFICIIIIITYIKAYTTTSQDGLVIYHYRCFFVLFVIVIHNALLTDDNQTLYNSLNQMWWMRIAHISSIQVVLNCSVLLCGPTLIIAACVFLTIHRIIIISWGGGREGREGRGEIKWLNIHSMKHALNWWLESKYLQCICT